MARGLDSPHGLCDFGLILSPLSFTFLIRNSGHFSLPSVHLEADVNAVGMVGGERGERGEEEKEWRDQNLLNGAELMMGWGSWCVQQRWAGWGWGAR